MIETNIYSKHLAGIIPVAGPPLSYNMPWHDSLIPIHENYHAIEKAVYSAALAGCNTIWIILHRDIQPLIKKKIGEWIHDPETTWIYPNPFWNKREIPIYYVCIPPRVKKRRDSNAWSSIYGAKIATYISKKISKWVVPKKFLVISPYGVSDNETFKESRSIFRQKQNIYFSSKEKTFVDNNYLPFTFDKEVYDIVKNNFMENYSGNDSNKTFKDLFEVVDLSKYQKIDVKWHYCIDNWQGYSEFLGSQHNKECIRPKILVSHKWRGLVT